MKPARALPASLALLAAAACSNNVHLAGTGTTGSGGTGTGGTGTTTTTSTTAGPPSDVTGSVIDRYYGEGPPVDVPVDLTGLQVEALVQEGGAWKTYPGNGKADGTFTVPGVPQGWFMLDVAGTYVFTKAHQLDLGSEVSGRPDAVQTTGNATVTGNLQNLYPWQGADDFEWANPNGGGAAYTFSVTPPADGATSLSGEASTWLGALVDGSKKDVLYATQLTLQETTGGVYYTILRFLSFPGVEQKDGGLTTVSGTLVSVTADQKITLDLRSSEFAKLGDAVSPGASGYGTSIDVATLPAAYQAGLIGYTVDLLLVYTNDDTDVKLGTLAYGNPFPSAWGTSVYAGESWGKTYTAPGASTSATQYGSVYVTMPVAQASAGPLRPVVTPVKGLLVDGKSAFGPLTGVSLTPTLTWSPSGPSTPTGYRILVYEAVNSGATVMKYVTEIATPATTVPLPPDLLQKGHAYAFTVTAVVSPVDIATAPFRSSTVLASADVLTSLVQP